MSYYTFLGFLSLVAEITASQAAKRKKFNNCVDLSAKYTHLKRLKGLTWDFELQATKRGFCPQQRRDS